MPVGEGRRGRGGGTGSDSSSADSGIRRRVPCSTRDGLGRGGNAGFVRCMELEP